MSNVLIAMLKDVVERASEIEVTKGSKCWRLDDPDLPLAVGAVVVRARLAALTAKEDA